MSLPAGKKGTLDIKKNWYPKFRNHVMIFVVSNTLGTFIEFLWLVPNSNFNPLKL